MSISNLTLPEECNRQNEHTNPTFYGQEMLVELQAPPGGMGRWEFYDPRCSQVSRTARACQLTPVCQLIPHLKDVPSFACHDMLSEISASFHIGSRRGAPEGENSGILE